MTNESPSPLARPLVLLPACSKTVDGLPFHAVGDKYVRALAAGAGVQPLLLPNLAELADPRPLLDQVDGLLMTGSPSNVHPSHWGRDDLDEPSRPHDPARDAVSLDLIRAAIERDLPLFCICRGFQELNVALGGSLYPRLHEVEGRMDHRSLASGEMSLDYGPRHDLRVSGWFAELFGAETIRINSLHHQGIETLAPGLVAEGLAPDGTIEAVRVREAKGFAIGVQWHPEYDLVTNPQITNPQITNPQITNPQSAALFRAFGEAVGRRQQRRLALAA
ncbi:MAG: gamma-glutamyl-gamma-aminobutyrate hydrolase family protein [Kiloniellales bacterium]